jgi:hypothetical protein
MSTYSLIFCNLLQKVMEVYFRIVGSRSLNIATNIFTSLVYHLIVKSSLQEHKVQKLNNYESEQHCWSKKKTKLPFIFFSVEIK